MLTKPINKLKIISLLMFVVSACGQAAPLAVDDPQVINAVQGTNTPAVVTPSFTPAETEVSNLTSASPVVFTAVNGNLNIRRGPNISYNSIGTLKSGQNAVVQGRDLLGNWAMIEIPSSKGKTGWVRLGTEYSQINGDIFDLPEVQVDFAVPAYIRNCTFHNMTLKPTEERLFNVLTFPENQLRVEPGEYHIYDDQSVQYVEVLSLYIKEGDIIDIIVDGDNGKHKCN